ncbi:hypothetical protein Z946_1394 [Sulfitobacter noctilucicola]|uniref:Uncharacterized protein n=1 Tax=Sulfitobacter noctilucicola TaxID=1342301 RepID=A0A7W6M5N5_9RHOB|nr:DUF6638 family protein [Sulfitobacter noctilucicola]KIN62534.1 hypothetical protein Z946_1394 [Sulfitobacter noctilucicola]MBB4172935.1 hypothetical protein [Sulfitobacter noctilucicola]
MNRLIQHGLMFGNLFHVASPALVDRYNRALNHLSGKTTKLTDFHIDISGYSPEVGDELKDHEYLNHQGVNRQFILLSMEQRTAPLLNMKFSTSRGILKEFIQQNEAQLFALTARDAVAGELVNSVYDVSTPARLFDYRRVEVEADTTSGAVKDARELGRLVGRFKNDKDGWYDDVLISEMITLAGKTGDITRNPVKLNAMSFDQRNFWTAHFGGMYLFQDVEHPAVIAPGGKDHLGELPLEFVFDASEPNRIAQFLTLNGLAEPIFEGRKDWAADVLRQKMDFVLIDAVTSAGGDLSGTTRADMRSLARRFHRDLSEEFHALNALVNWIETGSKWPLITSDHPAYFYTLRASDTKDAALVNMLLAELAPKDARQMFICHKELFYDTYRGWSEAKKAYVVDFLVAEYQVDKAGARDTLFGHDAPMEEPERVPVPDMIAKVGPWGAVRRR